MISYKATTKTALKTITLSTLQTMATKNMPGYSLTPQMQKTVNRKE